MNEKAAGKFTYSDYIAWPDDERWELIGFQAYNMTLSPTITHQKIANKFNILFSTHPNRKPECFVGIAPIDVVFSEHDVVQPDVLVVCDEKKVTEANIQGAPDLTVEVISPATALKDKREKKALYESCGVKQYIIVDPNGNYAERFLLGEDGAYGKVEIFGPTEVLHIAVLEDVKIPLWEVFDLEVAEESRAATEE